MWNFLNVSRNFLKNASSLAFLSLWRNGGGVSLVYSQMSFILGTHTSLNFQLIWSPLFSHLLVVGPTIPVLYIFLWRYVKSLPLLKVTTINCVGFFVSLGKLPWGLFMLKLTIPIVSPNSFEPVADLLFS